MPRWNELAEESLPGAANLFCYHLLIDFMGVVLIAIVCSLQWGGTNTQGSLTHTNNTLGRVVSADVDNRKSPEMEREL